MITYLQPQLDFINANTVLSPSSICYDNTSLVRVAAQFQDHIAYGIYHAVAATSIASAKAVLIAQLQTDNHVVNP